MKRNYPFDEFPEKESDWNQVIENRDYILMWLGQYRDHLPPEAIARLQDLLGVPKDQESK